MQKNGGHESKSYGIYRQTLLHMLPVPNLHKIVSTIQYSSGEGQVLYG